MLLSVGAFFDPAIWLHSTSKAHLQEIENGKSG